MMHCWTRPDSVPFPSVWCRFEGRKEIDGVIPKFWIQDIPEDQYEIVINYMVNEFLNDEPICLHSKLTSDKESVEEMREIWKGVLNDKVGLICYAENPDPSEKPIIAAMNCTHVVTKTEKKSTPKLNGAKAAKVIGTLDILSDMRDAFTELKVDKYLNAMGLYVLPKFRGQGLGLELLKAREPLCKAMGIKASLTAFTALASQIIATRAGFKDFSVISYADLEKLHPTMRYPGIQQQTKVLRYMYNLY